jgi:hypothetical protein
MFDTSRRTLLASLGTVGIGSLAGCSGLTSTAQGATDIILHNEAANRLRIDVRVTKRDDSAATVDTSLELGPNERRKINNEVLMGSDYEVEVAVTDESGDSSEYTETQEWTDAGKPLHVIVREQIVFAVQVG